MGQLLQILIDDGYSCRVTEGQLETTALVARSNTCRKCSARSDRLIIIPVHNPKIGSFCIVVECKDCGNEWEE